MSSDFDIDTDYTVRVYHEPRGERCLGDATLKLWLWDIPGVDPVTSGTWVLIQTKTTDAAGEVTLGGLRVNMTDRVFSGEYKIVVSAPGCRSVGIKGNLTWEFGGPSGRDKAFLLERVKVVNDSIYYNLSVKPRLYRDNFVLYLKQNRE